MRHVIKIDNYYLERVLSGEKTFEIRYNDRDYQVGDRIIFRGIDKADPDRGVLCSEEFQITYVSHYEGIQPGYVVFGIKKVVPEYVKTHLTEFEQACIQGRSTMIKPLSDPITEDRAKKSLEQIRYDLERQEKQAFMEKEAAEAKKAAQAKYRDVVTIPHRKSLFTSPEYSFLTASMKSLEDKEQQRQEVDEQRKKAIMTKARLFSFI